MADSTISFIESRGGKTLLIIVVIVSILFLGMGLLRLKNQPQAIPVVSILEKVEYIQELELIRYSSREIIALGLQDRLQKKADKMEKEVEDTKKLVGDLSLQLKEAETLLEQSRKNLDAHQSNADTSEKAALNHFHKIPSIFNRFVKMLDGFTDTEEIANDFGQEVNEAYQAYHSAPNGADKRAAEKNLQLEYYHLKKGLHGEYLSKRDIKLQSLGTQGIMGQKREMKSLEKQVGKLKNQLAKAQADYQTALSQSNLYKQQVDEEFNAANPLTSYKRPVLFGVIPGHFSTYIDLGNAEMTQTSDSVITFKLDSIYYGTPQLDLDSGNVYNVAEAKPTLQQAEGGLYHLVWEEIQENVEEIGSQMIQTAKNMGIETETCEMAKKYLENLAHAYGFQAKIIFTSGQCPLLSDHHDDE